MSEIVLGTTTDVKTAGFVPVRVGAQIVSAQVARDLTVAAGDLVVVATIGSVYAVVCRLGTASTGSISTGDFGEPPTAPSVTTGKTTVVPVQTVTYRPSYGWRTDNDSIYQGVYGSYGNAVGCAFYGNGLKSLRGSTVTAAWLKAKRLSAGVFAKQQTTLVQITQATKPAGAPTTSGTTNGPNLTVGSTDTHVSVPTAWAQALVDGTVGGLGLYDSSGSPYVRYAGLADYSGAFALTLQWTR